jgi:carbon starvation protein CstA
MDFWFEFLDVHMNGKVITCHDCFKWKNINIYQIFIIIFCGAVSFFHSLDCDCTVMPICMASYMTTNYGHANHAF